MSEVPKAATRAAARMLFPGTKVGPASKYPHVTDALEAALPALRKQWEEELLGDEAVLAATKAHAALWGVYKPSEKTRLLVETGNGIRAALEAIHPDTGEEGS